MPTETQEAGKHTWVNQLVSPYAVALFSYLIFIVSCSIPPTIYTGFMHEPDLMFMDIPTIVFYTLCVVAFLLGVWIWGYLFPSGPLMETRLQTKNSPILFVAIPLFIGIAGSLVSSYLLVRNSPNLLTLLLAQQGQELKEASLVDDQSSVMAYTAPILNGMIWWAYFRSSQMSLTTWEKWTIRIGLFIGVLTSLLAATLKLSRSNLMVIICGLIVLFVQRRAARNKLSSGSALRLILFMPLLFSSFAILRGSEGIDIVLNQFAGYSVASYNRLAAVINGHLVYPYSGTGKTLFSAITTSKTIAKVLPFRDAMRLPDNIELFGGDFSAVSRAGLDPSLVWAGAFGYIYSDIGWYTPLFLLGYGLFYGYLWQGLRRNKLRGILLYPWAAFCILFWVGGNYLTDSSIIYLALCAIALWVYERLFSLKIHNAFIPQS